MFNYIATGISSQQPISHTQRVASYSFKQLTLIKRFVNRTWFCYLLFEVVYRKIRNRCGLEFVWVTVHYKDLNWNYVSFWNWMTHICFFIETFSTTTLMTVSFKYFFFSLFTIEFPEAIVFVGWKVVTFHDVNNGMLFII